MANPLQYTIEIPSPRERVWQCMLDDAGYRDWTSAFCEGSYFEGEWRTGADIRFLGPGGGGMRARIERADHPSCVSIQHLGELRDGAAGATADWVGTFERYRLHELPNGGTRLDIELTDVPDEYVEMMNRTWPQALARLLRICVDSA